MQTMFIPSNLPNDGFKVPIAGAFTGFKFFPPLIAFSKNTASPSLVLCKDCINYKVSRRKISNYSDIESIDVGKRAKNLIITFKDSIFRVTFHICQREDLIEVAKFFQKKSVPLSDKSFEVIQQI